MILQLNEDIVHSIIPWTSFTVHNKHNKVANRKNDATLYCIYSKKVKQKNYRNQAVDPLPES